MENVNSSLTQTKLKLAHMDIPAINACAAYSYGFSSVHRQLAKAKAQREGHSEVTTTDVEATAVEACQAYLRQLEKQADVRKNVVKSGWHRSRQQCGKLSSMTLARKTLLIRSGVY